MINIETYFHQIKSIFWVFAHKIYWILMFTRVFKFIMFPNLLKIMKITYLLFFLCKHTPADQYMASMDACCNFSSLLSAVLLCPNSSSLFFSSLPNGLSLHAWSVQVVLVHLYSSVFSLCLLLLCCTCFYCCLSALT